MKQEKFITHSIRETQALAEEFAGKIQTGNLIAFFGNLGSGKTTFIQGFARGLGIKKRIISPTFIILRSYALKQGIFYHLDLYRTKTKDDLLGLGLPELMQDKNAVIALEWAEKLGDLMPEKRYEVYLKYLENDQREIIIKQYE